MNISISPETQKLIEQEMKRGGYPSPDDVVQAALQNMHADEHRLEDLDEQTLAAIERAEGQSKRGESLAMDDAFERLRQKHFGN
ncbi:MAG TPA: hypothetical protein VG722_11930 [Tepidisphaeraceae bacterium]|nr:hypothetical protein [Tepidisphaeraceae bacterium]